MTDLIQMSPTIGELAKSLATAQGLMEHAKKSKVNPFHKSKYADLADVIDAVKNSLSGNGLSVVQLPATEEGYLILTTILIHSSGEWIKSTFKIKSKAEFAQDMGSTLTYARRYALSSLLGISADDDDDGNYANGKHHEAPVQKQTAPVVKPQPQQSAPPLAYVGTPEQKAFLGDLFKHHQIQKEEMPNYANALLNVPMKELESELLLLKAKAKELV